MTDRNNFRSTSIAILVCIVSLVSACGGSENSAFPGGGGTGAEVSVVSIGPISGFGSIIVNGVRYQDSMAILQNDLGETLSSEQLRLGMMVEVRGESNVTQGVAETIRVFSELKGIVDTLGSNSITVNGTLVTLVDSTIYYEAASLVVGDQVEVYGIYNSSRSSVIATRIERKTLAEYKLRGVVSAWDTNGEQFNLGSTRVSYAGISLPSGFANGVSVRVYSNAVPDSGVWPLTVIRTTSSNPGANTDRIELEGIVSEVESIEARRFRINNYLIDASAAVFSDGIAAELAVGRRLEVKGRLEGGLLIAETVEFEDSASSSSGSDSDTSFEVFGLISNFESISSFTVRNVAIDASQATRFDDGSVTDLVDGACVEIRGGLTSTSINTVVLASRIKFEDDC